MDKVTATLEGVSPLIQHNGQLADPTNKWVREIKKTSKKRNKTDEDFETLKRLEFLGGMYMDENGEPTIPADMVLAAVIEGAKKTKNGKNAKAGVFETQPNYRLEYTGPRKPAAMYKAGTFCDYRIVVVNRARTMRARPIFRGWSTTIELLHDPEIIDRQMVVEALITAGERVGIGDYRPRYGRFSVTV
jgi:hypothetical protein